MSAASQANLQQAALVATAVASTLAASPGAMTPASAASILGAVAAAAGPLVSPQVGLAMSLATLALSAIHVAQQGGVPITAEQLDALFAQDDAAIAADLAAHPVAAAPTVA